MVLMAVGMRFWQEYKSALSAESLKKKVTHAVRVRRPKPDGSYELKHVSYEQVVPGEVAELAAGDLIPVWNLNDRLLQSVLCCVLC